MTKLQRLFYPNGAIRILKDHAHGANVIKGEILRFSGYQQRYDGTIYSLCAEGKSGRWYVMTTTEGELWEWVVKHD